MKKYIGLFIVFVLGFILNAGVLQATDGSEGSSGTSVETSTTAEIQTDLLIPVQKTEQEKAQESVKKQIEERRQEIKDARSEMEIKREKLREEMRVRLEGEMEARKEYREEVKTERDALKTEYKDKKDELKGTIEEVKARARTWVANGLLQRAENLTQISTRVKARIEKLNANGIDTTAATAFVVQADASIELSKVSAQKVKDGITNGDTLEEIKLNIDASKEAMKQAHDYLKQAVQGLKAKIELKIEAAVAASL